jgi:hypothetical protein
VKSDGGKGLNGTGSKPGINIGKEDLETLRIKLGVPETQTIAIGKTDVKGLEGKIFEGGSPKVRKEAGLPDLDTVMPIGQLSHLLPILYLLDMLRKV